MKEFYTYLKEKPYDPLFEKSRKTGRIIVMRGSRQNLVKVVLFQLRGRGYPLDDTMPNFFPYSKSSILGITNEVLFVNELLCDVGQH